MKLHRRAALAAVALFAATPALVACGDSDDDNVITLGYFANVTHAPALIGLELEIFKQSLPDDVEIETRVFNAGPSTIEALFAGDIDAAYIGPNPAINGWAQSGGEALHIISGSASGGAGLVTNGDYDEPSDLEGTSLATPQLANTQDVALRYWLAEQGYESDQQGDGDVGVVPTPNAELAAAFGTGSVDGAWAVEPFLSELVIEHDAELFLDERDLWDGGEFVTTHIIASDDFLEDRPDQAEALLGAHLEVLDFIEERPEEAREATNDHLFELSGNQLSEDVLEAAFENLTFTSDPIAPSLQGSADHAEAVDLLEPVDLEGIYELDILNDLLSEAGQDPISGDLA